jgi:glycosyltransferase involved in cell wall biosynthesis
VYNWCAEHLAADPELSLASLAPPPPGARALRGLARLAEPLGGAGAPLPRRVVRRVLWTAYGGVRAALGAAEHPGVAEGQVYHSPFDPLPRRTGRARRFLTVYDVIPLLHPELFTPQILALMKGVYASLRPGDRVFVSAESTRAELCALLPVQPEHVHVVPLAADRAVFHPVDDAEAVARVHARHGIPAGPYLLSLNTLEPRKNLEHAIRAFSAMVRQERIADLSLVLVGARGWKYDGILAALEQPETARDRIILAGFVPDEDLAALYSGALGFVYPSLYEGFGLPPLEAMQCGVPVITSNTSSLPEVVGDAGILLDPRDADVLSQAMLSLYRDAALRGRLAARALARASRFSWERFTRQTLDAYRAALAA